MKLKHIFALYFSQDLILIFFEYISNKKLYNKAKISRIDNFIIYLIRSHIVKSSECIENNLINAPYYIYSEFIQKTFTNGFIPPEAFVYLDSNDYI